jgi:hypothetical protein
LFSWSGEEAEGESDLQRLGHLPPVTFSGWNPHLVVSRSMQASVPWAAGGWHFTSLKMNKSLENGPGGQALGDLDY